MEDVHQHKKSHYNKMIEYNEKPTEIKPMIKEKEKTLLILYSIENK